MSIWLDGRVNTRTSPQENFGREVMELFTFGVGHYAESDVYAAARACDMPASPAALVTSSFTVPPIRST